MKISINQKLVLYLVLIIYYSTFVVSDKVEAVLSIFDLDWDDIVIEKGENWVEKYYIK